MAETHLDHPGEVSWFAGHRPLPVLGPCPHTCAHRMARTVAWGPDFEHYTLIQCDDKDGCAGKCRGWLTEYPDSARWDAHDWMQVAA